MDTASVPFRKSIFLFSHPLTASKLFLKILNLDNQPPLVFDGKSTGGQDYGYFFISAVSKRLLLAATDPDEWTAADKDALMTYTQILANGAHSYMNTVEAAGQDVFIKEHVAWLSTPAAEY